MKRDSSVIATGMIVSPGQVTGPVKIVQGSAEVKKVGKGDIMVVTQSSPAYAIGVMKAAGLLCEKGGMMTHICIVAKELGIPCLTQVKNAAEIFKDEMIITIDATEGVVKGG